MAKKIREGQVYSLRDSDGEPWSVLVGRVGSHGVPLGYFFLATVKEMKPESASLISAFGTVGIENGEWKLLHESAPGWERTQWAQVRFKQEFPGLEDESKVRVAVYDDRFRWLRTEVQDARSCADIPSDALVGHKAIEWLLSTLSKRSGAIG